MLSEFGEKFDSDLLTLPFMQEHFKEIPTENVLDSLYEGHRKSFEHQQSTELNYIPLIENIDDSLI